MAVVNAGITGKQQLTVINDVLPRIVKAQVDYQEMAQTHTAGNPGSAAVTQSQTTQDILPAIIIRALVGQHDKSDRNLGFNPMEYDPTNSNDNKVNTVHRGKKRKPKIPPTKFGLDGKKLPTPSSDNFNNIIKIIPPNCKGYVNFVIWVMQKEYDNAATLRPKNPITYHPRKEQQEIELPQKFGKDGNMVRKPNSKATENLLKNVPDKLRYYIELAICWTYLVASDMPVPPKPPKSP